MKRLVKHCCGLCLLIFCGITHGGSKNTIVLSRSVVKILALSTTGKQNMGSGVVIGHNTTVTNCHVTRTAEHVYLIKEGRLYIVVTQAAIPELDVCILKTETLPLPRVTLAHHETIKLGDHISIYGYPLALGIRMKPGNIIGLHPYQHDKIIEINAGFSHGSSGGALFNKTGDLIGIITFMGYSDNHMHFYAVPASWIIKALEKKFFPLQTIATRSFWENGEFKHLPEN